MESHLFVVSTGNLQGPQTDLRPSYDGLNTWAWRYDSSAIYQITQAGLDVTSITKRAAGGSLDDTLGPWFSVLDDSIGDLLFIYNGFSISSYSLKSSVEPLLPPAPKTLVNVSTRAVVGTDNEQLIGGFIITGQDPKTIILRALGPSLPVPSPISNPSIKIHDGTGAVVATNDNWNAYRDQLVALDSILDDRESGLVVSLDPGPYTAVIENVDVLRGVGLFELYDLTGDGPSRVANLSTRLELWNRR